ncbi:glutathione S-transferase T2-like [Alnus glutinosa]|uniref:glutathione S-transferase T2-like n=1 Tax=Alnus glutinosa TaxID=3517 RepID=UPI002D76E9C8|nr:glutathione S-transferase T2-like [Alnus glutinosa]XP_062151448.1 glutathione S-transferase T2-like [Alnus glutinosa]
MESANEICQQEPLAQVEVEPIVKKSQRGGNFNVYEDNLLVSAWININISLNPVEGNEQKHKKYWNRIWEYFHEHKNFTSGRSPNSLMNRWSTIQLAIIKFCGYLAQVESRQQSGVSEQDKICKAKLMYQELQSTTFHFEHCWNVLRFHPKWVAHMQSAKLRKRSVVTSSPSTPDPINLGEDEVPNETFVALEQPIGRETENDKRKRKERTNSDVTVILNEIVEDKKKTELFVEARDQEKEMLHLIQEDVHNNRETLQLEQAREEEFCNWTPDPINLGEEEVSHETFVNLERPISRKVEKDKRKRKERSNSDVIVILNEIKEDKKKKTKLFEEARDQEKEMLRLMQEDVRIKQEKVCIKQEEVRIKRETLWLEQAREEDKLMLMDTSGMSQMQQEYFHGRKMEILESRSRSK